MDNMMTYLGYIILGGFTAGLMVYFFYLAFKVKDEPETPKKMPERPKKNIKKSA